MTTGIALSVIAGGTVAVLALLGVDEAIVLGAIFPGLIAVASGAVLVIRGSRLPNRVFYRQLLGSALTVWGAGQLWNGVAVAVGTPVFPTPGDMISFLAAP